MWYRTIIAKKYTSVIVALWLKDKDASKIALSDNDIDSGSCEPKDNFHITLLYVGDAEALKDKKEMIQTAVETFAKKHKPITGVVGGVGCFNGDEKGKPFYASFDSPDLNEVVQSLTSMMESLDIELDKTHGFTPHITLAYLDSDSALPNIDFANHKVTFDSITLAWAGEQFHYDLSQG
jgi:2'-5' RNA ligase